MGKIELSVRILLVGVLLTLLPSTAALADGKAYTGVDLFSLVSADEKEQVAAIHHRDGVEKMMISINFTAEESESALWIFPVLGAPTDTDLDVVESFPVFTGYNPRRQARKTIENFMLAARATLILPALPEFMPSLGSSSSFKSMSAGLGDSSGGIQVYRQINKWGIHAETITAESTEALSNYLSEKKTRIPADEFESFKPYLSDGYVLVVAWIDSWESVKEEFLDSGDEHRTEQTERWPCLYVEFPTEKTFYPMRPTSGYGEVIIPVRLLVVGHVELETVASIRNQSRVAHNIMKKLPDGMPEKFKARLPSKDIPYTSIDIYAYANEYTDDLWFSPTRVKGLDYTIAISKASQWPIIIPLFFVFVAIVSYVCAGVAGLIVFRKWQEFARLGLWNMLTAFAFMWAIERLILKRESNWGVREDLKSNAFFVCFQLLFVIITLALQFLLQLPFDAEPDLPIFSAVFGQCFVFLLIGFDTIWHLATGRPSKKKSAS